MNVYEFKAKMIEATARYELPAALVYSVKTAVMIASLIVIMVLIVMLYREIVGK